MEGAGGIWDTAPDHEARREGWRQDATWPAVEELPPSEDEHRSTLSEKRAGSG